MKEFLGYGRSRSSSGKGDVIKRHFNEYVNCLHTQVGTARENMEVLVAEFLEPIECAMRGRNPENPSERGRSNGKYKQRIEMGSNISNTITSVQKDSLVAEPMVIQKFGDRGTSQYSVRDIAHTIPANPMSDRGQLLAEPLRIPQATKQGYIEVPQGAVFDMSYPESTTRRGRVQEGGQVSPTLMDGGEAPCYFEGVEAKVKQIGNLVDDSNRKFKNPQTGRIYDTDGLSPTVNTCQGGGREPKIATSYRIRKLTPRECFRLMGVTETDIDKIQQSGVSQSQQYKMAGNSIVVDCLYHMFRKMFTETACESQQLSLF